MKTSPYIALLWLFSMVAFLVWADPIAASLFIMYPIVKWAMILVGSLLLLFAICSVYKYPKRSIAGIAFVAIGLSLFFTCGFEYGRYLLFQLDKPAYVSRLSDAESGILKHNVFASDDGPPKRFAFKWYGGILDNWTGVVYDPTGEMMEINEAKGWAEVSNHKLAGLFGGTYYHCQDVGDGWYICWFT